MFERRRAKSRKCKKLFAEGYALAFYLYSSLIRVSDGGATFRRGASEAAMICLSLSDFPFLFSFRLVFVLLFLVFSVYFSGSLLLILFISSRFSDFSRRWAGRKRTKH